MSDDAHTIPDDTAAHYARLINEAENMRQAGADSLKQIYSDLRDDLKQLGWVGPSVSAEVAALKGAISEMRLDEKAKTKREARGERVDDYVSLLTRARARGEYKKHEQFDPVTGELLEDEQPETATRPGQDVQSPSQRAMAGENLDVTGGESAATNCPSDDDAISEVNGNSGLENAAGVEPSSSGQIDPNEDRKEGQSLDGETVGANTGGDHVTAHQSFAAQAGASVQGAPAKLLRPHCRNPQMCGSGTIDHCHSCKVAMRERDVA